MTKLKISAADRKRLDIARNLWLATVRPNGSPHLVPIWFVWLDDKAYLCTARESVKAKNIVQNTKIAFALEDGDDPVLMEGTARVLDEQPQAVVEAFAQKFEWNITKDETYTAVIELTPIRVVL